MALFGVQWVSTLKKDLTPPTL